VSMKNKKFWIVALLFIIAVFIIIYLLDLFNVLPGRAYSAEDFDIELIQSSVDYNDNGVDDYTDIMLGARKDAEKHPKYDGSYYAGGYPPENIGVCTDVVWRAFKNAGYSLKDMVDKDIATRPDAYTEITKADPNIDFRRVKNLRVFFEKYAVSLTIDADEIAEWQPGDIVIFGNNKHIGIVSNKRNKDGQPYIIHNGGQFNREEDYFKRISKKDDVMQITGHYRFDASLIDDSVLVEWQE